MIGALLPIPESGQSEWIELANQLTTPIQLGGWFITDASGQRRLLSEQELMAGATVRISLSRALLNNSGDSVQLHDPSGTVIDTFRYSTATVGSVIRRQPALSASGVAVLVATNVPMSIPPAIQASAELAVTVVIVPTNRRPASLLPRVPVSGALPTMLSTAPAVTSLPVVTSECTTCVQPNWSLSRIAAAILGVLALLLFVAEPTSVKTAQRDQDML